MKKILENDIYNLCIFFKICKNILYLWLFISICKSMKIGLEGSLLYF